MKTFEEVKTYLLERGYKEYQDPLQDGVGIEFCASKKLPEGSTQCDTNEHKISWHVKVYEIQIEYATWARGIELEIVAEKKEHWFNLKSYAMRWDGALEKMFPKAEQVLLLAWEQITKYLEENKESEGVVED
jgi:hypothetical protein